MGKSFIDLTGRKVGMLTIKSHREVKNKKTYWLCLCECGKEKLIYGGSLRRQLSNSCGCMVGKYVVHGRSTSKEYSSWACMLQRCNNPKVKAYKDYGARGIKVDEKWHTFKGFYDDMGSMPDGADSIERLEVNGNYELSNCIWATRLQQAQNKRNNRWLEADGKRMVMAEWGRYLGVSYKSIFNHLKNKTFQEVFNFYTNKNKTHARFKGKSTDSD